MFKRTLRAALQASLAITLSCGALAAHAASHTVTFEGTNGSIADSYAGLSGWDSLGNISASGWGTGFGDYFFHGHSGVLTFDNAPVVFEGMHYNLWSGLGYLPTYTLYYQNQVVFSAFVDASTQPLDLYWLPSGYTGLVDKIEFYAQSDGYAFDNLTYSITAVPEPETYALLLGGLVLVGGAARRHRRRSQ